MSSVLTNFTRRRLRNLLCLFTMTALVAFFIQVLDSGLGNTSEFSGWLLASCFLILLLYQARKRLSMFPLGNINYWLQAHLYLGIFAFYVFLSHLHWQLPKGWLDLLLASSFLIVLISGILGIILIRYSPSRLTQLDEEIIYERIPEFNQKLIEEAERIVLNSVRETNSNTLSEFYIEHAAHYMDKEKSIPQYLFHSKKRFLILLQHLSNQERYMNEQELSYAGQLRSIFEKKNMLDAHKILQARLKYWLYIHVPFAFVVVPLLALHIILVYAFGAA